MSWLITGEAIFFGFYFQVAATEQHTRSAQSHADVLGWVAFSMSCLIYASIIAAVSNLASLRKELDGFCMFQLDSGEFAPIPNVSAWARHRVVRAAGLVTPVVLPPIFMLAWLLLLTPAFPLFR
jgi:hypothetical protein